MFCSGDNPSTYSLDTGTYGLGSGNGDFHMMPRSQNVTYFAADYISIDVANIKDYGAYFSPVSEKFKHFMIQFRNRNTQRFTGICGIVSID
ncbi:hypothetical protein ACNVJQ_004958 [Vibrio harveyi]